MGAARGHSAFNIQHSKLTIMAATASAPADRQLGGELSGIADASGAITDSALDFANQYAGQALGWYPKIAAAERAETWNQRRDDTHALRELGPKLYQNWLDSNPNLRYALDAAQARLKA